MSKNYFTIIFLFFCFLISQVSYSQEPCATDILHQQKLASDPAYKANFQKMQLSLQKHIAKKMANDAVSKTENRVYQIPVVVHVIHTGREIDTFYNPSDSSIKKIIKVLNENFRAIYSGADIEIEFVLAKRSPDCTPTTGINRVDGSVLDGYVQRGVSIGAERGVTDQEMKALSVWSNIDYYNIWIINRVAGGRAAGYATYPNTTRNETDGIVIVSQIVNAVSTTLTHEFGHGFFLYHTFYRAEIHGESTDSTDCPENTDCTTQGDEICDTDPHGRMYFSDCKQSNCGILVSQATLNNYMSYCSNRSSFTPNQKIRMRTALETLRGGLLTSLGATPPNQNLSVSACVPTNIGVKTNVGITRFVLDELNIFSQDSEIEQENYFDRTCTQQLILDSDSKQIIKVETSTTLHNVKVYVDYNNDGDFIDEGEEIASGNTEYNGNIQTFNAIYQVPYSDILFNQPLRMRVVASANEDGIATSCQVFNGQAEDYSLIINKVACFIDSIETGTQSECNQETNTYSQSLTINYSNAPPTGNLVINNQSFAITQSPQTITLTNLDSDDKLVNVLASFSDETDCQFIKNDAFTAPHPCIITKKGLFIYPNPTPNEFSYSLSSEREGEHTIQIFDAIGKLVLEEKKIKTGVVLEGTINLETQPKGLYLLQISDSQKTTTVRIVKE
ncbi:M43 family zinc metalloprotease [Bernardetia sp. OM2101]|uniref:zinc-dependent metalloprotease n=1 Tax=Bernardetia sp. OM2101 TaxID=3344876 RepID=UPI0035CEE58B